MLVVHELTIFGKNDRLYDTSEVLSTKKITQTWQFGNKLKTKNFGWSTTGRRAVLEPRC